jgi:hypothetical protein
MTSLPSAALPPIVHAANLWTSCIVRQAPGRRGLAMGWGDAEVTVFREMVRRRVEDMA